MSGFQLQVGDLVRFVRTPPNILLRVVRVTVRGYDVVGVENPSYLAHGARCAFRRVSK